MGLVESRNVLYINGLGACSSQAPASEFQAPAREVFNVHDVIDVVEPCGEVIDCDHLLLDVSILLRKECLRRDILFPFDIDGTLGQLRAVAKDSKSLRDTAKLHACLISETCQRCCCLLIPF